MLAICANHYNTLFSVMHELSTFEVARMKFPMWEVNLSVLNRSFFPSLERRKE